MNISNKDFEEICQTALVTSYPRMFTDIPYEKEISEWLNKHEIISNTQYKDLAPEIEARYKLINKILDKSKIKQVLELASGYSSRGLIYSQKGYKYIELDLEPISKNKQQLVNYFLGTNHDNLIIQSGKH